MVLHHRLHGRIARLFCQMAFNESHLLRAGFPHSDICGSMLVCQLPAAFRRLPRPSSPVIAKASTTCTLSLDPITVHPRILPKIHRHRLIIAALVLPPLHSNSNKTGRYNQNPATPCKPLMTWLYFFQIVKEQNSPGFKKPEPSKLPFAWL
jgi:hypothetical protein